MADVEDFTAYFNDDGSFANALYDDLKEILGNEFEGKDYSEMFKRAGNIQTFLRNAIKTKTAYDTKMDNIIQKPGDDATDVQMAEFRKLLLKELGAVERGEDYGFNEPTLPEGMIYDAGLDKFFSDLFAKVGMPKDVANEVRNAFIDLNIKNHKERAEAENKAFGEAKDAFLAKYPGDKAAVIARLAHDFYMNRGSDDIKLPDGTVVKGLKSLIKESDLYNDPTNFEAWRTNGVNIDQIELVAGIQQDLSGGGQFLAGSGGGGGGGGGQMTREQADQSFIAAANAESPELAQAVAGG